jgi:hypothetical protein
LSAKVSDALAAKPVTLPEIVASDELLLPPQPAISATAIALHTHAITLVRFINLPGFSIDVDSLLT